MAVRLAAKLTASVSANSAAACISVDAVVPP